MSTVIKICGITRVEDGLCAVRAGADWLGFVRCPKSPRYRPLDEVVKLLRKLRAEAPQPFQAVGVYVDAPPEFIAREAISLGLDRIQLHGKESPQVARVLADRIALPIIKAVHVRGNTVEFDPDSYANLDLLADTYDPLIPGGTGVGYEYHILSDLIRQRRVIIAGGLKPETVKNVVAGLRPYGVDVSSGVESAPGIKAPEKIEAFVKAVRAGESSPTTTPSPAA